MMFCVSGLCVHYISPENTVMDEPVDLGDVTVEPSDDDGELLITFAGPAQLFDITLATTLGCRYLLYISYDYTTFVPYTDGQGGTMVSSLTILVHHVCFLTSVTHVMLVYLCLPPCINTLLPMRCFSNRPTSAVLGHFIF